MTQASDSHDRTGPARGRAAAGGTALVTTSARSERPRTTARLAFDAGFLAHLLAARAGMPEQRAKRRAAPDRGAAAYRHGEKARPAGAGQGLDRSA